MQEQNPYAPPESNLTAQPSQFSRKKTIEEALASDYDFSIGDVLANAWAATNGFKMHTFLAFLIIFAIAAIVGIIEQFIPEAVSYVTSFVSSCINTILFVGLYAIALKHLRGERINFSQDFFAVFALFIPLLLAYLVTTLLTAIGMLLFVIPGIYLAIAYSLSFWIILDHPDVGFWQAMETSRKLVSKHWFKVFGLYLVEGLILMVSAVPLGIGLIWTLPLLILSTGILYRTIFGEIE